MKKLTTTLIAITIALTAAFSSNAIATRGNPLVRLSTTYGEIEIELYRDKAPITVKNFLGYVRRGHYNGTIFHRVIKGFMIQSGDFMPGMKQKEAGKPIKNEADNGLKNETGTIAMARTSAPHSASAQFFINTANNRNLDHKGKIPGGWGYAVFGKVIKGMKVVRTIENTRTHTSGFYKDVPVNEIMIRKAIILKK